MPSGVMQARPDLSGFGERKRKVTEPELSLDSHEFLSDISLLYSSTEEAFRPGLAVFIPIWV
jgi:hypothetical protein